MPDAPAEKLSQQPLVSALGPRDLVPILRSAQDETDPAKRNPLATRTALRVWLGVDGAAPLLLSDAQITTPAALLYAITGLDGGPGGSVTWNNSGVTRTVLVQGLPNGTWDSEGRLVLAAGGSQRVNVDVVAGTYTVAPSGGGGGLALDFAFDAGSANARSFTLTAAYAATYATLSTGNVASATLDGQPLAVPVQLAAGTTYTLTITRTTAGDAATLSLTA